MKENTKFNIVFFGIVILFILALGYFVIGCSENESIVETNDNVITNGMTIDIVYWEDSIYCNYSHTFTGANLFEGTLYLTYNSKPLKTYFINDIKALTIYGNSK